MRLAKRTFLVHYTYTLLNSMVKGVKKVDIRVNPSDRFGQDDLDRLVIKNFKKDYTRTVTILKIIETSGYGMLEDI